jgi:hypothetical protein
MRLKSSIWVKAYVRRCQVAGVSAYIVRHGDDDAGAIFIRINRLDGSSDLFGPAPAGLADLNLERQWMRHGKGDPLPDSKADGILEREIRFDSDLWIVEVEDREGRHFLDGSIAGELSQPR